MYMWVSSDETVPASTGWVQVKSFNDWKLLKILQHRSLTSVLDHTAPGVGEVGEVLGWSEHL